MNNSNEKGHEDSTHDLSETTLNGDIIAPNSGQGNSPDEIYFSNATPFLKSPRKIGGAA